MVRTTRVAVVDDDDASCRRMVDYLNRYEQENGETFTVTVFTDGEAFIGGYAPVYDILLLDIQMQPVDGVQLAHRVRERDRSVVIVFITSAPQYAIKGYEVGALSYLLKPLPWFAFSQELKRCIDQVRRQVDESMIVADSGATRRVDLKDMVYVESVRHSSVMHTLEGQVTLSSPLKDLESRLEGRNFYRSNSCYLVNLAHVVGVEGQDCLMSTGERLRISRPRKKAFLTALAAFVGGQR
ncbi:DNA-binding response regulator [Bifidobacterium xylocopae]|uniref:DNA-binding response regulator n=2 Tax=Bifidobacterium xylocopae TaxID=2493119 RepID=A0A366KD31_9BIFI|nr:DNA-binding response regulator [Bifidobacterium xylocopae]